MAVTDNSQGISCGPPDLTAVTISVTDDLVPKFGKDTYESNVNESATPNTPVLRVSIEFTL